MPAVESLGSADMSTTGRGYRCPHCAATVMTPSRLVDHVVEVHARSRLRSENNEQAPEARDGGIL